MARSSSLPPPRSRIRRKFKPPRSGDAPDDEVRSDTRRIRGAMPRITPMPMPMPMPAAEVVRVEPERPIDPENAPPQSSSSSSPSAGDGQRSSSPTPAGPTSPVGPVSRSSAAVPTVVSPPSPPSPAAPGAPTCVVAAAPAAPTTPTPAVVATVTVHDDSSLPPDVVPVDSDTSSCASPVRSPAKEEMSSRTKSCSAAMTTAVATPMATAVSTNASKLVRKREEKRMTYVERVAEMRRQSYGNGNGNGSGGAAALAATEREEEEERQKSYSERMVREREARKARRRGPRAERLHRLRENQDPIEPPPPSTMGVGPVDVEQGKIKAAAAAGANLDGNAAPLVSAPSSSSPVTKAPHPGRGLESLESSNGLVRVVFAASDQSSEEQEEEALQQMEFTVPVSLVVHREREMADLARTNGIPPECWSGSLLARKMNELIGEAVAEAEAAAAAGAACGGDAPDFGSKLLARVRWHCSGDGTDGRCGSGMRSSENDDDEDTSNFILSCNAMDIFEHDGGNAKNPSDDDEAQPCDHGEPFTFILDPQAECSSSASGTNTTLVWTPLLTSCIRSYYNNGSISVPDDCTGNDALLALEYFGIVYSPDQLVFDSFGAYLRVKLWSDYYNHRGAMASWVVREIMRSRSRTSYAFVTCPEPEAGPFYLGLKKLDVFYGGLALGKGEDGEVVHSCSVVHDFFNDADDSSIPLDQSSISSNDSNPYIDSLIRQDFCSYLEKSLPGTDITFSHRQITVGTPVQAANPRSGGNGVTFNEALNPPSWVTTRAVLRIDFSGHGKKRKSSKGRGKKSAQSGPGSVVSAHEDKAEAQAADVEPKGATVAATVSPGSVAGALEDEVQSQATDAESKVASKSPGSVVGGLEDEVGAQANDAEPKEAALTRLKDLMETENGHDMDATSKSLVASAPNSSLIDMADGEHTDEMMAGDKNAVAVVTPDSKLSDKAESASPDPKPLDTSESDDKDATEKTGQKERASLAHHSSLVDTEIDDGVDDFLPITHVNSNAENEEECTVVSALTTPYGTDPASAELGINAVAVNDIANPAAAHLSKAPSGTGGAPERYINSWVVDDDNKPIEGISSFALSLADPLNLTQFLGGDEGPAKGQVDAKEADKKKGNAVPEMQCPAEKNKLPRQSSNESTDFVELFQSVSRSMSSFVYGEEEKKEPFYEHMDSSDEELQQQKETKLEVNTVLAEDNAPMTAQVSDNKEAEKPAMAETLEDINAAWLRNFINPFATCAEQTIETCQNIECACIPTNDNDMVEANHLARKEESADKAKEDVPSASGEETPATKEMSPPPVHSEAVSLAGGSTIGSQAGFEVRSTLKVEDTRAKPPLLPTMDSPKSEAAAPEPPVQMHDGHGPLAKSSSSSKPPFSGNKWRGKKAIKGLLPKKMSKH